jgi:hypothetical protein
LSGVGTTPGVAVRATRDVSPHVALEVRGLYARPSQQFGSSTLFIPEAQVQFRWNVARFAPYVGVGTGAALVTSPLVTDWDPTISFSGGTAVRITEQLAVLGELRLRGIEWRFTGSTAEVSAGLAWRFSTF